MVNWAQIKAIFLVVSSLGPWNDSRAESIAFSKLNGLYKTSKEQGPQWESYQGPSIRVRIAKGLNKAVIGGLDLKREIYITNDKKTFSGSKKVEFDCRLPSGSLSKMKSPVLLASLSSPSGVLSLDVDQFQGQMHVVADSAARGCDIINETTMERYLSTLLNKEMNSSWPLEALKAQAVAARTYALYKIEAPQLRKKAGLRLDGKGLFDLESSEKHQVSGTLSDSTAKTLRATFKTKGEVLVTKSGRITPIFFHAKCGGHTLKPSDVWDNDVEGYKSVDCPYCRGLGKGPWQIKRPVEKLVNFMKWYIKKEKVDLVTNLDKAKIQVAPDKESSANFRLYVDESVYVISKGLVRKYFGRIEIPSNNYVIYQLGKDFVISGDGKGHGVGMCQLGALELAKRGYTYKAILAHYFPGHHLEKAY